MSCVGAGNVYHWSISQFQLHSGNFTFHPVFIAHECTVPTRVECSPALNVMRAHAEMSTLAMHACMSSVAIVAAVMRVEYRPCIAT